MISLSSTYPIRIPYVRNPALAKLQEILFFVYIIYSNISKPLDIYIPYSAAALLGLLACLSVININWKRSTVTPFFLIGSISATFILVQLIVFRTPITYEFMMSFLNWIVSAIVILCLIERKGFITRFALMMFIIGISLSPFLTIINDTVDRQTLETGTNLENANTWAAWMGFCALVFWLWGWKSKKLIGRLVLWALFFASLIFLMRTVSRGALIALMIGILVGFRGIPGRKWLFVIVVIGIILFLVSSFSSSLFASYSSRFAEESGRFIVWPIALQAIQVRPFFGYGLELIVNHIIVPITPHNGILLIWLASGMIPALIFIYLWGLSIFKAYNAKWMIKINLDPLPLIIFAFLEMNQSNISHYMSYWALVCIFSCFMANPIKDIQRTQAPHAVQ